ncbi:5'-nucleotidase domain-containing protein 2 [Tachyglossus aculeatus]|uniref:5'-nucleotidase domain-containing protein 2 n=1 Tax=Tachyglossus aculeatus TaxID=9261 RepID=UPI0018F38F94|nr:5'-nucleotidase domain-containing protein 2 [Tachyglossus aculeatus]
MGVLAAHGLLKLLGWISKLVFLPQTHATPHFVPEKGKGHACSGNRAYLLAHFSSEVEDDPDSSKEYGLKRERLEAARPAMLLFFSANAQGIYQQVMEASLQASERLGVRNSPPAAGTVAGLDRAGSSSSSSCRGCGPPTTAAPPRLSASGAEGAEPSDYLRSRYREMRKLVHDLLPPGVCNLLNPAAIYANNEISLGDVEIYGFDYDYTLAQYSNLLHSMIFNAARDILIEQYKYPEGIKKYDYIPGFAVRGLHYDVQKSLLMKIDAFHYVQLGTVYRGLQPVPDEEVIELYGGTQHIPLYQLSDFYGKGPAIKQFMDIFSLPEMTLLSSVVDHFITHNIEFDQVHLFKDITDAIKDVHVKGMMYQWIEKDMEKFILHGDETFAVLNRLLNHNKKLFLITNSPFSFVNKGMKHMVGKNWRELFDMVIVQADKPNFFTDRRKPFRKLDESGSLQWDKINRLEKGMIYRQGNLFDFLRLTGWRGSRVLYFGDHLYSDLADLMLRHGWRTGAIVPELETEIRIINTEQYMHSLTWQQALTGLLERMQMHQDEKSRQVLMAWMRERQEMRSLTKNLFNPQFGSIFRTFHNPTYFSRRLVRFSDLYMSSISCLLNYNVNFTFYPRRTPLQHEAPLWMDQLCTGCMKTPFLEEMVHIR